MNSGAEFRSIRESRGLSLEAVAARTRIPLRMIEALEGNDLHSLPARPYARGFVIAYARELGLNATEVVPQYFSQFDAGSAPESPAPPGTSAPRGRAMTVAVTIALAGGLAFAAITWRPPAHPAETAAPVSSSGVRPAAAEVVPEAPAPTSGTAATAAPAAATAAPAARPTGELVVSLDFAERCWITATVDGTRVLFQTMEAGATQTLTARRQIVIRVGNAGVVNWSVNGRSAAPMGRPGEVRTVTLSADEPLSSPSSGAAPGSSGSASSSL